MMDPENKPNNTTETENLSDEKLENISGGKYKITYDVMPRPDKNFDCQLEDSGLSDW